MNFIYISPQFPRTYWNFCDRLKRNGIRVLGIGDTAYEQLSNETRSALDEYYYVSNMESYDEMLRAVAYFTFKYGKIDWLESNNEYWMDQDARLRQDFHITSGYVGEEARNIQHKSKMKAYYEKAGIKTARWHLVSTLKDGKAFVKKVGYPLIVKPDIGVGASATYKMSPAIFVPLTVLPIQKKKFYFIQAMCFRPRSWKLFKPRTILYITANGS